MLGSHCPFTTSDITWTLRSAWWQSFHANLCFPTLQNEYSYFPSTPHTTPLVLASYLIKDTEEIRWEHADLCQQPDSGPFCILYSYSLPFILLLWGKHPRSDLELTNLPPALGILSLAFSGILRWRQRPSFLPHHWALPLFHTSPTCTHFLVPPDLTSHSRSYFHSSCPHSQHGFLSCLQAFGFSLHFPNLFKSGSAQPFLPWPLCCQL